jgi:hypothetical protein
MLSPVLEFNKEKRIMLQTNRKRVTWLLAVSLAMSNLVFNPAVVADTYDTVHTERTGGTMLADTFLVRPVMLTSTVVGLATFIVTLPFSALGGNIGEAGNTLVVEPAKYTFVRPLGEL